jgi:TrmH family RNA methyltransferase
MLSSTITYPRITSRQHAIVNDCRRLARAKREAADDGRILIDGAHVLEDAIAAGVPVRAILVSADVLTQAPERALVARAARAGAAVHEAGAAVLDAASPVRTTSGLVAIAEWRAAGVDAVLDRAPALAVGLVDVQDPGNVGAVIRSVDALSGTGAIAIGETAHPAGWRALRGAMGSTFRTPVARATLDEAVEAARRRRIRIVATASGAATPIDRVDFRGASLVLMGNEGAGLPPHVIDHADQIASIPMSAGVESMNVAVTAALILYEARRQRAARA